MTAKGQGVVSQKPSPRFWFEIVRVGEQVWEGRGNLLAEPIVDSEPNGVLHQFCQSYNRDHRIRTLRVYGATDIEIERAFGECEDVLA